MGLMCTYFVLVDTFRRNMNEQFKRPLLGPFLVSGVAATYPFQPGELEPIMHLLNYTILCCNTLSLCN